MRLESARVCNYRAHRDVTVEFDPRMTLICGPNESGKSTLVEAIHRGLFLKARAGGETLESMKSPWGDAPQVELSCRFGEAGCRIRKIFRGGRGDCVVDLQGQETCTGDEAETRLAALLSSGDPIEGRGAASALRGRWAHLWVWQGTSGSDPAGSAAEQNAALLKRLQAQGGSAVMQSDLDTKALRDIQQRAGEVFVAAGTRYRRESNVSRAEEDLHAARAECQEKQQVLAALQEASDRYLAAAETILAKQRAVVEAEAQLRAAQNNLQRAEDVERRIEPLTRRIAELDREIEALEKAAKDLTELRNRRQAIQAELAPMEVQCHTLAEEEASCRDALRKAEQTWDAARQALATAGARGDALADRVAALERARELAQLEDRWTQVRDKREERDRVAASLAELPAVSDKLLSALGKADRERETAQAQLDALGARIEVLEAGDAVSVDGQSVASGSSRTITDEADVRIGGRTHLRIRPGQSTTLTEARQQLQKAGDKCAERLASLGVATVDEAIDAAERRKQLDSRLDVLKAALAALGDDSIEEQVRLARQASAEATAKADRSAQQAGVATHATLEEIRQLRVEAERVSQEAEREEGRSRTAFEKARERCEEAQQQVAAARAKAAEANTRLQEAATRITTLEEVHGSDGDRARILLERQAGRNQAQQQSTVLKADLATIQPETMKSDVQRLISVVDGAQQSIRTAEQEQAAAIERMRLHGTTDPHADLEAARVRQDRAEKHFRELEAQAKAIQLLAVLAEECQQRMAQQFTRPLVEAVQGYLECVFGAGASLGVEWKADAGAFTTLTVSRERQGLGNFPFDSLSGGAREQVGVAMRLAMAEVLAADHGGCLPIVLDDAFTNSDPDRVRLLHRMLYRAVERGLQLIVLTSNPDHYNTLGAKEVRLTRPVLPGVMAPMLSGAVAAPAAAADDRASPQAEGLAIAVSMTPEQSIDFLESLKQLGGSSGNQMLREALGWDEATYTAVKDHLVERGAIMPGRGRGGSVRLPTSAIDT